MALPHRVLRTTLGTRLSRWAPSSVLHWPSWRGMCTSAATPSAAAVEGDVKMHVSSVYAAQVVDLKAVLFDVVASW